MFDITRKGLLAALIAGVAWPALAADPYYPPAEPAPPVYEEADYGGWYIRGDLDYHESDFRGATYQLYDPVGITNDFDFGNLDGAASAGVGLGYKINKYLRADLTGDWWFKSNFRGQTSGFCVTPVPGTPCSSVDRASMKAFLLLANAYVDIGTWHGITPYVGAGIGGAWVKWNDLHNTVDGGTTIHHGGKGWRFAYAAMAGASYCLTKQLKLDAGYRFSHIEGGRMFDYANGGGPGYDHGFNSHEVRGGLRYQFGKSDCEEPETVVYEPEPIITK